MKEREEEGRAAGGGGGGGRYCPHPAPAGSPPPASHRRGIAGWFRGVPSSPAPSRCCGPFPP